MFEPRTTTHTGVAFALALTLLALTPAWAQDPAPRPTAPAVAALGFVTSPTDVSILVSQPSELPVPVWIGVEWSAIETGTARYDWSAIDRAVDGAIAAGYLPALRLSGPRPPSLAGSGFPAPTDQGAFDSWVAFSRAAARRYSDRVETFQVWGQVGGPANEILPNDYAFVLKTTALAIRAEAGAAGRNVRIAQATLAAGGMAWQREIWQRDAAAYMDVLPIGLGGKSTSPPLTELSALMAENLRFPPAAAVWALVPADREDPWRSAGIAVAAIATGASLALVPVEPDSGPDRVRWVQAAASLLREGYAPAPTGSVRFEDDGGGELPGATVLGRFFSDRDFTSLVFYRAPGGETELPSDRMIVQSSLARNARLLDLLSGRELRAASSRPTDGSSGKSIRISRSVVPRVVKYETAPIAPGFELPPEAIETRGTRDLTAEEVIARHQAVAQLQDDRLDRWSGVGRADLHFKLARGSSTVDIGIVSNFFWQRDAQLEWEQVEYFVNGNLVRWKNIPELPLIQPEKVVTVPLDLTLDKTYVYRMVGRSRVEDRDAYVLEFLPGDPDSPLSLYRGRVWVDAETFVRLKVSLVQSGLEPPVISNEEVQLFRPVTGPDGETYWMLVRSDGQQIWKAAGENFVVRREQTFEDIRINPPATEFESAREQAYASNNQMLRDTDKGLRYLERKEDGTRAVKEDVDSSQIFAGFGAFRDSSTDGVTPLGGVNYFNYDLWGRNIQVNAFFAGVLGFFTASDPDFLGGNLDATLSATGSAIKFEDKVFSGDRELLLERIESRRQNASFQLGIPVGSFVKFDVQGSLSLVDYFDNDDGRNARATFNATPMNPLSLEFRLPQDHQQVGATVGVEYNRRGYTVAASASTFRRSDWEEWGLFDTAGGSYVAFDPGTNAFVPTDPEPVRKSFSRWQVAAFKEWYLPKFQKLRGEINYLDGADLDRYSRYQFSLFGDDRLNGFSGTGVRFDSGWIARAGYSFNLFEAIRFDATLEQARVEEDLSPVGSQSFTGLGLAGNFLGPWKSVISLSYGRALASDIPELEGENEFLLIILKLF